MELRRIKETCLYVKDLDRSRSFYESTLGAQVISHVPGDHVFFRIGESVLLCFLPEVSAQKVSPPPHYGEGELHVAFEVDPKDYEKWQRALRKKGVVIEQFQTWHKGKRSSFYFRDPDRNLLEILQGDIWTFFEA